MSRMEHQLEERRTGAARWAVATVVAVLGATVALATASGFALLSSPGLARVREVWPALVVSVVVGVLTVLVVRLALRRPLGSPWLLLGAAPASLLALDHVGLT